MENDYFRKVKEYDNVFVIGQKNGMTSKKTERVTITKSFETTRTYLVSKVVEGDKCEEGFRLLLFFDR